MPVRTPMLLVTVVYTKEDGLSTQEKETLIECLADAAGDHFLDFVAKGTRNGPNSVELHVHGLIEMTACEPTVARLKENLAVEINKHLPGDKGVLSSYRITWCYTSQMPFFL